MPVLYVWVLTNMEEVVFLYSPTRECDFLKALLKGFRGVLISDFYPGYDSIECLQQKCLIHLIRDFNNDVLSNSFNKEFKELATRFGSLLQGIVQTVDRFGLKQARLSPHNRDVERFYREMCAQEYQTEIAQEYRKKLVKYRDKLFAFLDHDGIPWNNNNAEHAIKQFAHYRTLADGLMSEGGIDDYLVLLSLCVTCKYKGVSFLRFLLSQERDIDVFAGQRAASARGSVWSCIPRGFLAVTDLQARLSHKGAQEAADEAGVGELFRKLLASIKRYFVQTQACATGTAFLGRMEAE